MADKYQAMMQFWTDRVQRYGPDPRSNTGDVWLREVEIAAVAGVLRRCKPRRVLDFGCANGYTTTRLAHACPDIDFVGIDINRDMISAATSGSLMRMAAIQAIARARSAPMRPSNNPSSEVNRMRAPPMMAAKWAKR